MDSGATCHMCNDREQFVNFEQLSASQKVTLGDGHTLRGIGVGTVELRLCYLTEAPENAAAKSTLCTKPLL